jgi:hypothetical protein
MHQFNTFTPTRLKALLLRPVISSEGKRARHGSSNTLGSLVLKSNEHALEDWLSVAED